MPDPQLIGAVLDGKFQIERPIASGASGDVYEATHLGLGTRVAVKVLRPGVQETAELRRKRFMREARVAARIQSDYVVRVFDIVAPPAEEEGPTYIVMELLHGETLAERAKRVGPMPIDEAVDYVLQAAKPLAEMHDAKIVHRDVKPSNLFVSREKDGKDRIKLIDFGVAAFRSPVARGESTLTFGDAVIGTPRYMAPEQIRSPLEVDARADVWALGVTLFVLLAGAPPFDGQTPLAVMGQIENEEPRPLLSLRADVPREIAAVVHRCLAKDPNARSADARALVEALAPFADRSLGGQQVEATKPTESRLPKLVAWGSFVGTLAVLSIGTLVVTRLGAASAPDAAAAAPAIAASSATTTSAMGVASTTPVVSASAPSSAAPPPSSIASASMQAPTQSAMTAPPSPPRATAAAAAPPRKPVVKSAAPDDDRIE
jgi:serine/threonine-protein kinase